MVVVTVGLGSLGIDILTQRRVQKRAFQAMEELYGLYGKHESFYGWYFPDETCIAGHFHPDFMDYANRYSAHAHKIAPGTKTLIAPYGTRILVTDEEYIQQLRNLDVDIVAYQDEVGVRKATPEETGAFYTNLRKAHDAAGRSALWADVEAFDFEGDVYRSALLPGSMERVEKQIEAVAPYVDEVLIYQYQGMFNKPGTIAYCGHPDSIAEYTKLLEYNRKNRQ